MHDHFRRFIRLLSEEAVEYLIIGGFAVARHGYARYTKDIDFFIGVSPENADEVLAVMKNFGVFDFSAADFLQKPMYFSSPLEPQIQILTEIPGVTFEECYAHRLEEEIDGLPVKFIDLIHLLHNKRAVGRPQDLNDVANLPQPEE